VNEAPIDYLKVGSLKPNFRDINLIAKVVNIGPSRAVTSSRGRVNHLVAEAFVGDETGSVVLTLWDEQIRRFKVGDVLEIRKGYTTLFKGSLRLNVSKSGYIEKVDEKIEKVNTRNNLSGVTHIQIPWRTSETGPFKRRKRR